MPAETVHERIWGGRDEETKGRRDEGRPGRQAAQSEGAWGIPRVKLRLLPITCGIQGIEQHFACPEPETVTDSGGICGLARALSWCHTVLD